MTRPEGTVRGFASARLEHWQEWEGHDIRVGPVIGKEEGGPLSAYYARFGAGTRAPLPAPYTEVWIVVSGAVTLHTPGGAVTAGPGDMLHVPEDSPGELEATEDTELACVSVPAH
jgi:ethanolamine utilization protein EutQ (cupin superfamily)